MRASTATGARPGGENMGSARNFVWGFVGQGCSSATNFGLSVMAGQLLGPRGLGIVFIGFVAYQLVLGLQRAVVTQPLIAQTAPLAALHRLPPSYSGLTVTLATGLA